MEVLITENDVKNGAKILPYDHDAPCSHDGLHPIMIIKAIEVIADAFAVLFNGMVEKAHLPTNLFEPGSRKGPRGILKNYRPTVAYWAWAQVGKVIFGAQNTSVQEWMI